MEHHTYLVTNRASALQLWLSLRSGRLPINKSFHGGLEDLVFDEDSELNSRLALENALHTLVKRNQTLHLYSQLASQTRSEAKRFALNVKEQNGNNNNEATALKKLAKNDIEEGAEYNLQERQNTFMRRNSLQQQQQQEKVNVNSKQSIVNELESRKTDEKTTQKDLEEAFKNLGNELDDQDVYQFVVKNHFEINDMLLVGGLAQVLSFSQCRQTWLLKRDVDLQRSLTLHWVHDTLPRMLPGRWAFAGEALNLSQFRDKKPEKLPCFLIGEQQDSSIVVTLLYDGNKYDPNLMVSSVVEALQQFILPHASKVRICPPHALLPEQRRMLLVVSSEDETVEFGRVECYSDFLCQFEFQIRLQSRPRNFQVARRFACSARVIVRTGALVMANSFLAQKSLLLSKSVQQTPLQFEMEELESVLKQIELVAWRNDNMDRARWERLRDVAETLLVSRSFLAGGAVPMELDFRLFRVLEGVTKLGLEFGCDPDGSNVAPPVQYPSLWRWFACMSG